MRGEEKVSVVLPVNLEEEEEAVDYTELFRRRKQILMQMQQQEAAGSSKQEVFVQLDPPYEATQGYSKVVWSK